MALLLGRGRAAWSSLRTPGSPSGQLRACLPIPPPGWQEVPLAPESGVGMPWFAALLPRGLGSFRANQWGQVLWAELTGRERQPFLALRQGWVTNSPRLPRTEGLLGAQSFQC